MITYKLRPDTIPVRINSETKTITNVVNKPTEKIISVIFNDNYYNRFSADAVNWPDITEEEFNTALSEVKAIHVNI